ncbi:MAG: tryptophan 7-halogenase [Colwellia sp.]|uniref:lysine-epsilon-oxidase maturase LodB n=1 Tax=Colwellia sp. TaxID=56799 RepID=UPI0025BC47FB|nr:lysine-epsilon-oxidase maturase LodB [Colwellia sp.]NQZ27882.1 tryptophan 7-halogenase [Colwellia sp.]
MMSLKIETDVTILGAGPSGACAALSLLNNSTLNITLVEQSDFSQQRVGEHVSDSLFNFLDFLNIEPESLGEGCFIPTYGSTAYWGSNRPGFRNSVFTTQESTYQLNRELFDLGLIETAVERGARVLPRTHCLATNQLPDGTWQLILSHPHQGEFEIHSRFIVDATGRKASITRGIGGLSDKTDDLMGVGRFFQLAKGHKKTQEYIIESCEHGWWYGALLPNHTYVVTFYSDVDIIAKLRLNQQEGWNKLLSESKHIKHCVNNCKVTAPHPWSRPAFSQITMADNVNNFLAIGDAACAFDPISSMGIGFAFSSACHGANAIIAQLNPNNSDPKSNQAIKQYNLDLKSQFDNYRLLKQKFYQQELRWPQAPFWQRRAFNSSDVEELALDNSMT